MVFIADSEIENQKKKEEIARKIQNKEQSTKINNQAKENIEKKHVTTDSEMIKIIETANKKKPKQKPITIDDIKLELEFTDLLEKRHEEEVKELLSNNEIREIKKEMIGILALPMVHPEKRLIFHHKLNESETVHNYVDSNVLFRWFGRANSHLKFGTVYALKYLQTHTEYAQYQHKLQALAKSREHPPEKPIQNENTE